MGSLMDELRRREAAAREEAEDLRGQITPRRGPDMEHEPPRAHPPHPSRARRRPDTTSRRPGTHMGKADLINTPFKRAAPKSFHGPVVSPVLSFAATRETSAALLTAFGQPVSQVAACETGPCCMP